MNRRWYWIVAVCGFLAGSLVWELRATQYEPPRPSLAERYSTPLDEPRHGFLILVRPASHRCEVREASGLAVATFECRPTGVRW